MSDMAHDQQPSEREQWYDKEIAPLLLEISKRCHEKGMSFLASVEYEPGNRGRTVWLQPDAGIEMTMLSLCAATGSNIDGYVMGLLRHAQEHGIEYSGSLVMAQVVGKSN